MRTILLTATLLAFHHPQAQATQTTLIQAGTLLATPGQPAKQNATIIIQNGHITEIRSGFTTPADLAPTPPDQIHTIDLRQSYILPGLIDAHVHLTGQSSKNGQLEAVTQSEESGVANGVLYAARTLQAGFTTVRDAGGDLNAILALRDGIAAGKIKGPHVIAAGEPLSATGGHADRSNGYAPDIFAKPGIGICDSADECRKAVRTEVKYRVDLIKIMATGGVLDDSVAGTDQQFTDDELRAIMQTAHALGRKVAAHAHGLKGIRAAVLAGVDSIEHGTFLDDDTARLMQQRGTYLVPTLIAGREVTEHAKIDGYFPPAVRAKAIAVGAIMGPHLRRAHNAGVKIAFGTDSAVSPHGWNAQEFGLMVKNGLTPTEAIQAATTNAADLLGVSAEAGIIAPGKPADIIAFTGDPTQDVSRLEHVTFVMKAGEIYLSPNPAEATGWRPTPPAER